MERFLVSNNPSCHSNYPLGTIQRIGEMTWNEVLITARTRINGQTM
jgi:hypothetical protein